MSPLAPPAVLLARGMPAPEKEQPRAARVSPTALLSCLVPMPQLRCSSASLQAAAVRDPAVHALRPPQHWQPGSSNSNTHPWRLKLQAKRVEMTGHDASPRPRVDSAGTKPPTPTPRFVPPRAHPCPPRCFLAMAASRSVSPIVPKPLRSVRIRSTTSVRLLHGLGLLPSEISGKMIISVDTITIIAMLDVSFLSPVSLPTTSMSSLPIP